MSEEEGTQVLLPPRPTESDPEAWKPYWEGRGQPWRTEPEISTGRQEELAQYRSIVPNIEKGIYPFKGMKLTRAEIEWLLATHDAGRGPVDWSDKRQRDRQGLDLRGADLRSVNLSGLPLARMSGGGRYWTYGTAEQYEGALAHMEGASFAYAHLEGASLAHSHLEMADLSSAHLEHADLHRAHLEGASLANAHLERAGLKEAHLEGTSLSFAHLEGANLRNVFFDQGTKLNAIILHSREVGTALSADVHWGDVNLAAVRWSQVKMLGDEYMARQNTYKGKVKDRDRREREYDDAIRANRQLAIALQAQGINEDAVRFNYRAQNLQKSFLWFQMTQFDVQFRQRMKLLGAWLFSWFLFLLAGYGYKPSRSFLAYLLVISGFATAYYLIGHTVGPMLSPLGAFVFSMASFHGRGFFPGNNISLDDPLTVLAAFEALVGLIIEVTFIATLTQRFFGK
jgi:uncharacterized protein YjbI with pentapeptide repeats